MAGQCTILCAAARKGAEMQNVAHMINQSCPYCSHPHRYVAHKEQLAATANALRLVKTLLCCRWLPCLIHLSPPAHTHRYFAHKEQLAATANAMQLVKALKYRLWLPCSIQPVHPALTHRYFAHKEQLAATANTLQLVKAFKCTSTPLPPYPIHSAPLLTQTDTLRTRSSWPPPPMRCNCSRAAPLPAMAVLSSRPPLLVYCVTQVLCTQGAAGCHCQCAAAAHVLRLFLSLPWLSYLLVLPC